MKHYFKEILSVSLVFCALSNTSCVNKIEDEIQESTVPISFHTKISKSTTRTSESAFEKGEQVGLFAMVTPTGVDGLRYINNLCLECGDDSRLIPEKEIFYPEGDHKLDFTSYYPYRTEGIPKGSSLLPISVQTDQSTSKNHAASDFMLAQVDGIKSGNKPVELTYKHQLVKVTIVLSPKEGEKVDDILKANPEIIATGFHTQANYNLQTGEISALSAKNDILPFGNWKKLSNGTLSGKEFIIIPQDDTAHEQAFVLEWNGILYTCPMPSVTMKGDTEFEIRIDALQTTSHILTGIAGNIKAWGNQESGESENNHNLTSIRIAALSFSTSDVYRVYHQSVPVAEICKEYLYSADNTIDSRAIVVYPVQDEKTDLREGIVLKLLDKNGMEHGGRIQWNLSNNSLTYAPGTSKPIESFYIDKNEKIVFEKPETPAAVNVSSFKIRDVRNGVLQTYPMVKVGVQYWMKEDLQTTCYNDGTDILKSDKLGQEQYYFEWEKYNLILYNGEAVLSNKLAPKGWKVPTEAEWTLLKNYINGDASSLKHATLWSTTDKANNLATNKTGLGFLPNGYFLGKETNDILMNHNSSVAFWIYDKEKGTLNKVLMLTNSSSEIAFREGIKPENKDYYNAFSIRCIKE